MKFLLVIVEALALLLVSALYLAWLALFGVMFYRSVETSNYVEMVFYPAATLWLLYQYHKAIFPAAHQPQPKEISNV